MRKVQHVFAALGLAALASLVAFAQAPAPAGQAPAGQAPAPAAGRGGPAGPASFFITSVGKGDGANYGGLAGADAYCAQMAQAGGIPTPPGRTWRAYLSATAANGQPAVNARDRIGAGPWYNKNGAAHRQQRGRPARRRRARSQLDQQDFALNEKGSRSTASRLPNAVGRHAEPARHPHGLGFVRPRARRRGRHHVQQLHQQRSPPAGTPRGQGPGVWLGHHDRTGGGNSSWNATHKSAGCSQANLVATGGAGLLYCFAAN